MLHLQNQDNENWNVIIRNNSAVSVRYYWQDSKYFKCIGSLPFPSITLFLIPGSFLLILLSFFNFSFFTFFSFCLISNFLNFFPLSFFVLYFLSLLVVSCVKWSMPICLDIFKYTKHFVNKIFEIPFVEILFCYI